MAGSSHMWWKIYLDRSFSASGSLDLPMSSKNLFGRQNLNSEEKWQSKNLKEFVMSTFSFNFMKYKFKEILYFKLYFCGKRCLVGEFNCFPE